MLSIPFRKCRSFTPVVPSVRGWPDRALGRARLWLSTDLRDGHPALIEAMDPARKLQKFRLPLRTGFNEIEVGFPCAVRADFDFVRLLIEQDLAPDEVAIQGVGPARSKLIDRTFEARRGARKAIAFGLNRAIARDAVHLETVTA